MSDLLTPKNILILDDDPDTAFTFERGIKSGGYDVISFTSSNKAFQYLALHPNDFDLVISDIKMPFMDGIEFAKKVKDQLPELGIVLVTAFEFSGLEIEMRSLGVREIARKPLSIPQLLAIVGKHVRSKNEILDTLYTCSDCKAQFLFFADVEEHKNRLNHLHFEELSFP